MPKLATTLVFTVDADCEERPAALAAMREAKAAIGDLLVYKSLAEKTLDLPGYTGQPFRMRLVAPISSP